MISVDPADTNRKFAEAEGADFPILSDPDKKVAETYGVLASTGQYAQRWTFYIGSDGRILDIDKKVSPSGHGKDLVARLAQLGVPRRKPSGH
jgi:peroxiredoxin Q/BCP